MATFFVYTYQFERPKVIGKNKQILIPFSTEEIWEHKQQLFSSLFVPDKKIRLDNNNYKFRCTVVYNDNEIIILLITYQKIVFLNTKDLRTRKTRDYKPVAVIFDNRENKQRMFVQRTVESKAFRDELHDSLNDAINKLMVRHFKMKFAIGEVPNYSVDVFWKEFEAAKSKLSNVRFSFPPPNLPRITDMAGSILGLREETQASVNMELKASKQGWLNIQKDDNSSFTSLLKASGESGATLKVQRFGSNAFVTLGGKTKDGMKITIDDNVLHVITNRPQEIELIIYGMKRQFDEL